MKVWTKISDYITGFQPSQAEWFQLKVHDTVVFTHEDVYREIEYFYSEWSYLTSMWENKYEAFTNLYKHYVNAVGENYYRMYDALTREYNPLSNYDMVESGVDGRKVSDKNNTGTNNSYGGQITADTKYTENPYERTTKTDQTGSVTTTMNGTEDNNTFRNAFNSGISDTGTHTDKTQTTFDGRNDKVTYGEGDTKPLTTTTTEKVTNDITKTTSFDALGDNDKVNFHDYVDTKTSDDVQMNGFNTATNSKDSHKEVESYSNDVSLEYSKQNTKGEAEAVSIGTDYTEGTRHELTRTGNIGVTTNSQLIDGELAVRKVNLLKEFVQGFILRYCSLVYDEE